MTLNELLTKLSALLDECPDAGDLPVVLGPHDYEFADTVEIKEPRTRTRWHMCGCCSLR